MRIEIDQETPTVCPDCQTRVAPHLLVCPGCQALIHSARLKALSQQAQAAESARDLSGALAAWREALGLLPPQSKQYQTVSAKVEGLSLAIERDPEAAAEYKKGSVAGKGLLGKSVGLGAAGVLTFLLTKGKLLLLGLTKTGTLFSMLLAFGVYWTAWGWRFALGLVLAIYVHEMGHVAALRKLGIKASAPTFIPGIGALVRMKQMPASPRENARVGLAGPVWGGVLALLLYVVYVYIGTPSIGAIAKVSAWINLFNLLPISPLDGGRGFSAFTRKGRLLASGVIAVMWYLTAEGLLILLLLAGIAMSLTRSADQVVATDRRAFIEYVVLVVGLTLLSVVDVPVV